MCAAAFILEAFLRNLDHVFVLLHKTTPPIEYLLSHHLVYVCVWSITPAFIIISNKRFTEMASSLTRLL